MDTTTANGAAPREQASSTELVRLTGVHKYYGGGLSGVHALHDIHLCVGAGEMVAICGPSGSGKTSLLNVVSMLDPATEGAVVLDHLLVSRLSEQARSELRADLLGCVFQSFSLVPVLSARDNVLLPLLLRGRLGRAELAEAGQRADELLAQVGLATQTSHFPARLDASQSQRVAIARALITRPRLVVADEPAARLDSGCVRMVMELFGRQQREHGTAFLISTRDQRQLSRATRTLQLNEGRLLSTSADAARRPVRVQL